MKEGERVIEAGTGRGGVLVGTFPRTIWDRGVPLKQTWAVVLWDDSDRRSVESFARLRPEPA
jgi:hypothetical protein